MTQSPPQSNPFVLNFLSDQQILEIHQSTLRVLSEVGIVLDHPQARSLLLDHGSHSHKDRICLPADLVEKSLRQCPNQVKICGRQGEVTLGDGHLHIHNLGGARDVLDHPGGDIRPATAEDVAESARLLDALENVSTITPLYTPRDVPAHIMIPTMFEKTLRNTLKPLNGPGVTTGNEVKLLYKMMQIVFGDSPKVSLSGSPVSPLNFSSDLVEVMLEIASHGLPFGPLPCPNVGATSPMSLAGSIVQQNAEVLASIVLAQLVNPGLPIVYCGRLSVISMRSGAPMWGNPEMGMMSAATVQLGHSYKLPVNVYGLAGSGYAADMQSGYERAINALVPALAGADELSGIGEMAGGTISSNAQMVIDNDIIGMVKRVRRGFSVDEDSLAVNVIAHAMDTSHNFLKEPHTRKYLHTGEVWQTQVGAIESTWDTWRAAGSKSIVDRAQVEAQRLLREHQIPPLENSQSNELDKLMKSALTSTGN